MKKLPAILFFTLYFLALLSSQGQTGNKRSTNDTLSSEDSIARRAFIMQAREEIIADSIKQAELELQLNALIRAKDLKQEEFNKKLDSLSAEVKMKTEERKMHIDSLRQSMTAFPVIGFNDDTLFFIYSKFGNIPAYERAMKISDRIAKLADLFSFEIDSIQIADVESAVALMVGENLIMNISDNDALWNNTTKTELAESYKSIIGNAVISYNQTSGLTNLLKEIGLALVVIGVIIVLIYYLIRFFRWTANKIYEQEGKLIKGIKIRAYTLLDAKHQINALILVNTILKWLMILVMAYIALPILFGIFPWTKGFAETLFGYILSPLRKIASAVWNYLPNLITIIVILFIFKYVLRGLRFLRNEIAHGALHVPGFYADWANPTYQIVRIIIFAFIIIVIFPYLPGSDSPVFKGVSVFLGFLFTFGSAGSLSNVISGLVLTYMRLFKIGDRVQIKDVTGDVIEKSLLVTRIRTIKNEIISIPNSTVMSSHTINYSSEAEDLGLILHTTVTIGYDVSWQNMHKALITAADRTEMILKDPKPFVLQTSLDDFYVSYEINAYTRNPDKQAVIYSQLHQHIQDCCNEAGIEIMSPHYRSSRDGNKTTIPEKYLDKNYETPSFNVMLKNDNEDKNEKHDKKNK